MTKFRSIFRGVLAISLTAIFFVPGIAQERNPIDPPGAYSKIATTFFARTKNCRSRILNDQKINCVIDTIWEFFDVSKDRHLSPAEINRFFRILSAEVAYKKYVSELEKFTSSAHGNNFSDIPKNNELAAAIGVGAIGAILTPILLANFDYDNNGLLSRDELFHDTELNDYFPSFQSKSRQIPQEMEEVYRRLALALGPWLSQADTFKRTKSRRRNTLTPGESAKEHGVPDSEPNTKGDALDSVFSSVGKLKRGGENISAKKETTKKIHLKRKDYVSKIKLYEFEVRRIDTFSKKNVIGLRFAIRNEGDRTVKRVEVTVYFNDKQGKPILEKKFFPVSWSSIYGGELLKPNYVKRMEEGKYYTIKELGPEWKEGAARAEVSDIEFSSE